MGVYRTGRVCPMQAGLKLHLSVSRICAFSRVHVSILCTLNILGTKSSSFNTLVIVVLAVLLGGVTGLAGVVVIVAAIVIGCCVCRRRRNLRLPLQTSNDVKIKGKVAANGSSEGPALETVMDGELIDFVKVSDV